MALVPPSGPGRAQDSSSYWKSFTREQTESQANHSEISVTCVPDRIARLDAIVHRRWATLREIPAFTDQSPAMAAEGSVLISEKSAIQAEVAATVDQPAARAAQPSAVLAEVSAEVPATGAAVAASPAKTGQFRGGILARPMTRFSEVLQRRGRKVPFPGLNPVSAS